MIAATADTRPHRGQRSLPGSLACPAFLCLAGGKDTKEINFFSGGQCLGRSGGEEDERQDLSVVHRHCGVALPLVSHHSWLKPLPHRSALGWGLPGHPCAHRDAVAVTKGPRFCPQQVLAELSPMCTPQLGSHVPGDRALGRDSHGHLPICHCPLWDQLWKHSLVNGTGVPGLTPAP